jgi:multidrug efflux system membrane fusion protein
MLRLSMFTYRMKSARNRAWVSTFVVASAIASAALIVGCDDKSGGKVGMAAMPQMPPPPVQVVEAVAKDVPTYLDEIGNATAVEMVAVRAQVAGRIEEIGFKDGDEIKKGQVLIKIDPRWYQAQLDQAKANLARAEAVAALAQTDLARAEEAIKGKLISQEQYDQRKNAVIVAEAEIKQRQADIAAAGVNLEYCTITSPIDGRAGKRLMDVGNVVKANDDNPMVVIERMDPVYADFTIAENRLSEIRKNLAAGTVKALVRLPEETGNDELTGHEGQLTFLDNAVQDNTGRLKLRATVANADRHFWPGQFVNIRLILNMKKDAVLVPLVAQQIGQQGPFVYVVKEAPGQDGKPAASAELRPITPGQRHGDLIVVNKGLEKGEKVVVVGQMMVRPGGPVMVVPSAPQQGAAPTASAAH